MPNNKPYMLFRYDLQMQAGSDEAEIMIYGSIVSNKWGENNPDVTALEFDKLLKQAKKNGAKRLLLRINSGGGSVFQAVSMKTMLMEADFEKITVRIDGLCASAATLFPSLPGAYVRMAEGGMMMIHNPSDIVWGTAKEMEDGARRLHAIESDMHSIYARRTGIGENEIAKMMNDETWLTAKMAKEKGFVDEIIDGQSNTVAKINPDMAAAMGEIYMHMPQTAAWLPDEPMNNSDAPVAEADAAVIHKTNKEETIMPNPMTAEQLRTENAELYSTIQNEAVRLERKRIADIRNVTPVGYEKMAEDAIANGTDVNAYMMSVLTAQKEKGNTFITERKAETAPAAKVEGGAPTDDKQTEQAKIEANAKEIAAYAKAYAGNDNEGMF